MIRLTFMGSIAKFQNFIVQWCNTYKFLTRCTLFLIESKEVSVVIHLCYLSSSEESSFLWAVTTQLGHLHKVNWSKKKHITKK